MEGQSGVIFSRKRRDRKVHDFNTKLKDELLFASVKQETLKLLLQSQYLAHIKMIFHYRGFDWYGQWRAVCILFELIH